MNEQKSATIVPKVGERVIISDRWSDQEMEGTVTGLTDGGFYWEDAVDDEVFWIKYSDDWRYAPGHCGGRR